MQKYDVELAFYAAKDDSPKVKAIKEAAAVLADEIIKQTPTGPEQTLALRHVEEAVLRAADSLSRQDNAAELAKDRKKVA
jgi:hypothetical protein